MHIINVALVSLAITANALVTRSPNTITSQAYVQVETDPKGVTWPWRAFKSSDQTPPNMTIVSSGEPLADGYIFMTPLTTNISVPYAKV
jgi:hypothetical protein